MTVDQPQTGAALTINEAISATMSQYMFVNRLTRAQLGSILSLPGQSISYRMTGRTRWAAEEIALLSTYFGVTPNDLMPAPDGTGGWIPASYRPTYVGKTGTLVPQVGLAHRTARPVVPQVGLEPTTDGL